MAKDNPPASSAHDGPKENGRSRWSGIGVAFINEKTDDEGKPVQTVSVKLNGGISINCSEVDIVLLPFKAPQTENRAS